MQLSSSKVAVPFKKSNGHQYKSKRYGIAPWAVGGAYGFTRSSIIFVAMYKMLRAFLFLFDPEWVHYFAMNSLKLFCTIPFGKKIIRHLFQPERNNQYSIFNIQFPNRVGLGAGFDKNARYLNELEALGFGFVEIGTVTPRPQAGNDKPRLFRLPKDKALINRMGFNNDGVEVIAERLRQWQYSQSPTNNQQRLVIGGNIGKNKTTPNEDAWKDYETCFIALHPYVDYFVVNVSSPNTPGLRELQEKDSLRIILTSLQTVQQRLLSGQRPASNLPAGEAGGQQMAKPILLKIAPDLTQEQIDDVIDLAMEIKLDGLVAANTTISREQLATEKSRLEQIGTGGLSGKPVQKRSTEMVQYIHQKTKGQIPVIASGGIFTAADAKEKLDAGAVLVQVWTGFIYEGPGIVKNICNHL